MENAQEKKLQVVIETPEGSRNKYKYDEKKRIFTLRHVLPAGSVFPYDFGFVPGTEAPDGDPLDVLVLMDVPAFPGCLITTRLLGNLAAEQREENGEWVRNDRLIAVAEAAGDYGDVQVLNDLNPVVLKEIAHFFTSYNQMRGKEFRVTGHQSPEEAWKVVQQAATRWQRSHQPAKKEKAA